jgi:nucleoside-diphosphate-sugar epimerase
LKIIIMGIDGYLGWPLAMHLSARGHEVSGVDNFSRRRNVDEIGGHSATPIRSMKMRLKAYEKSSGKKIRFYKGDLIKTDFTEGVIAKKNLTA